MAINTGRFHSINMLCNFCVELSGIMNSVWNTITWHAGISGVCGPKFESLHKEKGFIVLQNVDMLWTNRMSCKCMQHVNYKRWYETPVRLRRYRGAHYTVRSLISPKSDWRFVTLENNGIFISTQDTCTLFPLGCVSLWLGTSHFNPNRSAQIVSIR